MGGLRSLLAARPGSARELTARCSRSRTERNPVQACAVRPWSDPRMRRLPRVLVLLLALLVGACTMAPSTTSGLQLSGFDRNVRPQDDLFTFVNGAWMRDTQIPPDRSRHGSFETLRGQDETDPRGIIEPIRSAVPA